jgi:hypothetical protein
MLEQKPAGRRVTLGGDRGYDTAGFIEKLRERYVNPILRPRPLWFTVEVCKSVDARCGRSGEI